MPKGAASRSVGKSMRRSKRMVVDRKTSTHAGTATTADARKNPIESSTRLPPVSTVTRRTAPRARLRASRMAAEIPMRSQAWKADEHSVLTPSRKAPRNSGTKITKTAGE